MMTTTGPAPRRLRTRWRIVLAAAAVVAVGTAVVIHSAAVDAAAHARAAAEAPPRDASARQVTLAYLGAAVRHDCALMDYLQADGKTDWCPRAPTAWSDGEPELRAYRDVGAGEAFPAGQGTPAETCVSSMITQRWMNGDDPGTIDWSWCWVRTTDGWRLRDEGQG
ncbi:hypothetical protein Csp2054_08480 [Curtobacterium sp. 'Ferrero']|uniref:hypothetical protein n=1 Tax=Curtobacterium sp. 'Ferrero' TaxID=2033654 RepID=UPI000BDCC27A|nr:hypothetical protein [Curtobacterium sp. 'Ferrero']PCN48182.1 hypothetical protein Csp2054_08480 [Curtobacterium sp. 'Ferrero']